MESNELFQRLGMHNFIGGRFVRSEAKNEIPVPDAATEVRMGSAADSTDDEIDETVRQSNAAQHEWRQA